MATIIQLRRDNTVNWADADPILAEGEMGWEKSGNEITAYKIGDGVRKWSELPYGSNISILQELGDNETAVISQKAVTDEINKDRYMIYPSTGIMGSPIPDLNHVANYSSGGDFIAYNESTKYDCAWVNIYEGSKNLTITGATPSIIGYFSALLPTPESLLGKGTTIPTGAKICLVNFLKSANTGGYGNLKITQEGMPGTKEDLEVAKRDIKAVVSLSNCLADSFTATPVSINLLDTVNLLRNWGFQDGAVVNDPKFITSGKIYLKSMYYTVQGIRAYSTNLNLYIASFDFDGNYIGRTLIPLESASNLTKTFLYTKLAGAAYERIVLSSTGDLPSYANMQLEEGFTAHTPVAFQGWIFDESERDFVSQSRMRYSEYPVGKNYINESDLLYGYSLQNGEWIPLVRGVASNRLFLKDGTTYTVSNLAVFSPTITSMYLAYFDKDGNFLKRTAHAMVVDSTGLKGSCTFTANVDDGQTFYVRMILQSSNVNVNYVPNPQLEVGSAATAYEAYAGTKYVLEVKGSKLSEEKNVLLTGASFAFPDNEWFRYVCDDLGITGYNKAVSGETMQHTAQKMHDGTLYTQAEFEDFDIFLIFHSHNQTVTDTTNLKENYEDYVFPLTDRSAQWDYVLKKYAAECYAARLNTNSRWYGTKDGKPYRVVVVTHWHDARTIFNNSIRELQAKWGFTLCELDKRIGFSKNEVHPVTGAQVSILHCDNPSNNTEIIDGVEYGWHPTRNKGAWIQHRMADIIGDTLVTCEAPTMYEDIINSLEEKLHYNSGIIANTLSINKYNIDSDTVDDKIQSTTGNIVYSSGSALAIIPIRSNTKYSFNYKVDTMGSLGFYDIYMNRISFNVISSLEDSKDGNGKSFTTPLEAVFLAKTVRFSAIDTINSFMLVEGDTLPQEYIPFEQLTREEYNAKIDELTKSYVELTSRVTELEAIASYDKQYVSYGSDITSTSNIASINIWSNKKSFERDVYIEGIKTNIASYEDGANITLYQCTPLPDNKYSLETIGTYNVVAGINTILVEFVLRSGNYIGIMTSNCKLYYRGVVGPIMMSLNQPTSGSDIVTVKSELSNTSLSTDIIGYIKIPFEDKTPVPTTVFMGDSITWLASPRGWTEYFLEKYPIKDYINLARSGARWTNLATTEYDITSTSSSQNPDSNVAWNQYNKLLDYISKNPTFNPELIIMAFGANDFSSIKGTTNEAFADSSLMINADVTTVLDMCSSIRFVCELLRDKYPTAQLVIMTPLQRSMSTIANFKNIFIMGDLIEDCCKYLSIPCIRQDKEVGIYAYQENAAYTFTYDGLHPNEEGAKLIGYYLSRRLQDVIRYNI